MGNEVKIDLVTGTEKLKKGIAVGEEIIDKFAEAAKDDFQKVEVSSEELQKVFEELIVEIERLIDENRRLRGATEDLTEAQMREASAAAKVLELVKENIVKIAILTGLYLKYGAALNSVVGASVKVAAGVNATVKAGSAGVASTVAMTVATTALTSALIRQGIALAAALTPYGGAAAALGLIASAASLTATALDSTGESVKALRNDFVLAKKIIEETGGDIDKINARLEEIGLTAEEVGIEIKTNWSEISKSFKGMIGEAFNVPLVKKMGEEIKNYFKGWTDWIGKKFDDAGTSVKNFAVTAFDFWKEKAVEARQAVAGLLGSMMGADGQSNEEESRGQKIRKATEEAEKLRAIREVNLKESLDAERAIAKAKKENARIEKEDFEVASMMTLEQIEKEKKAHEQRKKNLIEQNKFQEEGLEQWLAREEKVLEREKELRDAIKARRDLVDELVKSFGEVEESIKRQQESSVIMNANVGQLEAMLSDVNDEFEDLAASGEENEKALRELAEKRLTLETQIHARKMQDLDEAREKELNAINEVIEAEKKKKDLLEEINSDRIAQQNELMIETLQRQGATQETIFKERMRQIDEEEARLIKLAETNEEAEAIRLNAIRQRANLEMHAIEQANEAEQKRIAREKAQAELLMDVEEARIAAKDRLTLAQMEANGAKESELHQERMKQIDAEEQRALKAAKTQEEQDRIRANAEKQRIQEKSQMDLANVKPQAKQGPRTRAEFLAQAKKEREARELAFRERKAAERQKKLNEKSALAAAKFLGKPMNAKEAAQLVRRNANEQRRLQELAQEKKEKEAKFAGGKGDTVGGKPPEIPLLEQLVVAAKTTNENEKKLIEAIKDGGGLV